MAASRDSESPSPVVAPQADGAGPTPDRAQEALALMVEALRLIDLSEGAGVAGAHLDLAIHRLQDWMERAAG
jgi:hypothetical protein